MWVGGTSWHDAVNAPRVAVVNEAFAQRMWPGASAIGEYFLVSGHVALAQLVGVAKTGKYHDLQEAPQSAVFLPAAQNDSSGMALITRS